MKCLHLIYIYLINIFSSKIGITHSEMRLNMELAPRYLKHTTDESFFLFGARGTGKSTWCLQEYSDAERLDLLAPDILRSYTAKPERLREYTLGQPDGSTIVIDEVQKAPVLLSVVHTV